MVRDAYGGQSQENETAAQARKGGGEIEQEGGRSRMSFVREFHGMRVYADDIPKDVTTIDVASLVLEGPTWSDSIEGLRESERK